MAGDCTTPAAAPAAALGAHRYRQPPHLPTEKPFAPSCSYSACREASGSCTLFTAVSTSYTAIGQQARHAKQLGVGSQAATKAHGMQNHRTTHRGTHSTTAEHTGPSARTAPAPPASACPCDAPRLAAHPAPTPAGEGEGAPRGAEISPARRPVPGYNQLCSLSMVACRTALLSSSMLQTLERDSLDAALGLAPRLPRSAARLLRLARGRPRVRKLPHNLQCRLASHAVPVGE